MNDQDLRQTVRAFLYQGKSMDAAVFLRCLGMSHDAVQAYILETVRLAGLEQERAVSEHPTFPTLLQKVKSGQADSSDWIELLQQGVYLENSGVFLPWGSHLARLEQSGGKLIAGSVLEWRLERVLGGLWGDVSVPDLVSLSGLSKINCRPTLYQIYGEIQHQPERQSPCEQWGAKPAKVLRPWPLSGRGSGTRGQSNWFVCAALLVCLLPGFRHDLRRDQIQCNFYP